MAEYSRHHFVPQFYLRNFAVDTDVEVAERRQIALFNVPTSKFVPSTSIRNQAQRKKLYGTGSGEKALSDLEGTSSAIIRRMVDRREVPKWRSGEHFTLLVFVLFQAFRTPTAAAELEDAQEQWVKTVASFDARLAPHLDQVRIRMPDAVKHALHSAALHHPIALDLRYKLLINRSQTPILTSDHPVVFYNQFMERRRKFGSATGLACKGLQLFLPLSPDCCLILFDSDVYRVGGRSFTGIQVAASQEDVNALNLLQVANAGTQLFFNSAMPEQEVRRLVAKGSAFRPLARTSVTTYPKQEKADGAATVLMHSSKTDLKLGLKLSNVDELPSASDYQLGRAVVHPRDPILCDLHDEFLAKIDAKQYRPSEFGQFIKDKQMRAGISGN